MATTGQADSRSKVLLSWSSDKDSAWTLYELRRQAEFEVVGLLTTLNSAADRVAMHAVRHELLRRQANATGLPLITVDLPWPCDNVTYESAVSAVLEPLKEQQDITHIAFGDLFLADIRDYRERQVEALNMKPLFPLWGQDTRELAKAMLDEGLRAHITCVDPRQIDAACAGVSYDHEFLRALPDAADPCGENGEFHTFAWDGPMFANPVRVKKGEILERDGFVYADLLPAGY